MIEQDHAYSRRLFFAILVVIPLVVYGAMLVFAPLAGWLGVGLPLTASAMVSYWLVLDRRYVQARGGATMGEQALHLGLFALALVWLAVGVGAGIGVAR